MTDLLNASERQGLIDPERIDLGKYRSWSRPPYHDFIVEINALPLAALIDDAHAGHRVYELMSILRPGDLLSYLWLDYVSVNEDVVDWVEEHRHGKGRYRDEDHVPLTSLPFVRFDHCFALRNDDTRSFEINWCVHRASLYWNAKLNGLLDLVRFVQGRLRKCNDYLTLHEIGMLDERCHRRDFLDQVERKTTKVSTLRRTGSVPDEVVARIRTLIRNENVQSVSCAYDDYALWRVLVEEQVRRSESSGVQPQKALKLSGPDDGLSFIADDWGGEIHIPYEGFGDGDIIIPPGWRRFNKDHAGRDGCLAWVFGSSECRFVLTAKDHGELECATRTMIGGWVLYESSELGNQTVGLR